MKHTSAITAILGAALAGTAALCCAAEQPQADTVHIVDRRGAEISADWLEDTRLMERARSTGGGLTIHLAMDARVQAVLEEELDKGLSLFHAKGGCMIAVDPKTGDILGMASRTGKPGAGTADYACKTGIAPASTFKVVVAAAALESGKYKINTPINCQPLVLPDGNTLSDTPYSYPHLPLWGVLAKSSNAGAARVAMGTTWPVLQETAAKFGLDKALLLPWSGLPAASIPEAASPVTLAHVSHGHCMEVTPMHMAMVYATLANGGIRMRPRLVTRISESSGYALGNWFPTIESTAISKTNAQALCQALESVTKADNPAPVRRGTATAAAIPGFRVGGKTGTARKETKTDGDTDGKPGTCVCLFAGILPADAPRMVIMTVIDEPQPTDRNPGGGTVAAPVFRAAAERLIPILDINPSDPEAYEKYKAAQNSTANNEQ